MVNGDIPRIDCLRCKHFAVTWDPKFPRSCRLYGFKTRNMPSAEVFRNTGTPCLGYEKKER